MPNKLLCFFVGTVKELREELEASDLLPYDDRAQEEIDDAILEQKTNSLDCHSVL